MDDRQAPRVSMEELLLGNTLTQEALLNVLVKKGLITRSEVLDEVRNIKASM